MLRIGAHLTSSKGYLAMGKQAVSIIKMAELLNDYVSEKDEVIKTDKLKVLVGHTPLQVVCGALLGVVISW